MRKLFIILLSIFCSLSVGAKERTLPKEYTFLIDVRDNLTHRPIDGAMVGVIAKNDSINFNRSGMTRDGEVEITAPSGPEKYTIAIHYTPMKRGKELWEYEKERFEYNIKDKYSKIQNVGTVYLKHKKQIELNEVSVTASKVMFYYKGDTLVYNADAFVLAQGQCSTV